MRGSQTFSAASLSILLLSLGGMIGPPYTIQSF